MPAIAFRDSKGSTGQLIIQSDSQESSLRTSPLSYSLVTTSTPLSGENLWAQVQAALRDNAAGMSRRPLIVIVLAPSTLSMLPTIRHVQGLLASGVPGDQGAVSPTGIVDMFDQADLADMLARTFSTPHGSIYLCRVVLEDPNVHTVEIAVLHEPAWEQTAPSHFHSTDFILTVYADVLDAFTQYLTAVEKLDDPGDILLLTTRTKPDESEKAECASHHTPRESLEPGLLPTSSPEAAGGGPSVTRLVESWNRRGEGRVHLQ